MLCWRRPCAAAEACASLILRIAEEAGGPANVDRFSMHPVVWDFSERMRQEQPAQQQQAAAMPWLDWMLEQGKFLAELHPHTGDSANLQAALQLMAAELPNVGWFGELLTRPPFSDWPAVSDNAATLEKLETSAWALAGYGHARQAWALQRHGFAFRQQMLGPDHPDTIGSGNHLANQLGMLGRHEEAAELLQRILTAGQCVLEPEHPDTLASGNNLANQLGMLGRHAEAAELLQRISTAQQRVLGPEHPATLASGNNLANQLDMLGRHAEAAELLQRILTARQCVLGPEHPDTLGSGNNLANQLGEVGRHAEAAELLQRISTAQQRVLGPEHPVTLVSSNNLAILLGKLGRHAEAAKQHRHIFTVRQRVLGPEHTDTRASGQKLTIELDVRRIQANNTRKYSQLSRCLSFCWWRAEASSCHTCC